MNSPTHTRTPRATLVQWLLDNPQVWEGYPKPIQPPGTVSHAQWVFNFMQNDGLFAPRSQCNPKTITRLVADARAAQKLTHQPKPQSITMA